MKRVNNLIPKIATIDNLYLAFWKAKKSKANKREVLEFAKNLDVNIKTLQTDILSGKVCVGNYHYFKIYDPKERLICASSFRERVYQHALMNVCDKYFERFQIDNSFACRKGKGTYAAIEKAKVYSKNFAYFAKLDVKKYFETIDHQILKQKLNRIFKDQTLLNLFYDIIDSYEYNIGKGLPIGNLTSQYFANFLLGYADHYIKEELSAKAYVRYMDDMVIWDNSLEELNKIIKKFERFLTYSLICTMKPSVINAISKGLPFLGYVIWKDNITLNKISKKRFQRKTKALYVQLAKEEITQQGFQQKILPMLAFLSHANSFLFQKNVILTLENNQRL